jgi:hypothetical protein
MVTMVQDVFRWEGGGECWPLATAEWRTRLSTSLLPPATSLHRA